MKIYETIWNESNNYRVLKSPLKNTIISVWILFPIFKWLK